MPVAGSNVHLEVVVRLRKQTMLRLASAAGVVALTGMTAMSACAQSGGRISFTGAIVAPSFVVTAVPGRVMTKTMRSAYVSVASEPDVTVSFISPPGGSAAASVALMPVDSAARDASAIVTANLLDHTGKPVARDANGLYRLDGHGAAMDLTAVRSAVAASRPFVVVVSYD
jgi:hypothetical protein